MYEEENVQSTIDLCRRKFIKNSFFAISALMAIPSIAAAGRYDDEELDEEVPWVKKSEKKVRQMDEDEDFNRKTRQLKEQQQLRDDANTQRVQEDIRRQNQMFKDAIEAKRSNKAIQRNSSVGDPQASDPYPTRQSTGSGGSKRGGGKTSGSGDGKYRTTQ